MQQGSSPPTKIQSIIDRQVKDPELKKDVEETCERLKHILMVRDVWFFVPAISTVIVLWFLIQSDFVPDTSDMPNFSAGKIVMAIGALITCFSIFQAIGHFLGVVHFRAKVERMIEAERKRLSLLPNKKQIANAVMQIDFDHKELMEVIDEDTQDHK